MRRSNGRTLTTHTGSLPRSDTLVNLLAAQNRGEPVDAETFAAEVESSTRQVIKNQAQSGIDVGNNGEQSRMSFSTYVTLRLSGFGGSWQRRGHRDQNEFPGAVRTRAVSIMNAPKCIGPVHYERLDEAEKECNDFLKYLGGNSSFQELFMTAASPGIIALTMLNEHYPPMKITC
jgi:5-methyltetrahydropteroyltriglutamate--homocysteine methyltransferase